MSMRLSCPHCGKTRDVEIIEREERVTIHGREVPFTARFSRCMICGEEFEAPGQLDANLAAAREAYARLYEAPKPEELVALRVFSASLTALQREKIEACADQSGLPVSEQIVGCASSQDYSRLMLRPSGRTGRQGKYLAFLCQ